MERLRDRIRALRGTERQTDFANRFGVDQATVSRWERGARPEHHILVQMAELAGQPLAFFDRPDPAPELVAARNVLAHTVPGEMSGTLTVSPSQAVQLGLPGLAKMTDKDALATVVKAVLASAKAAPNTTPDGLAALAWTFFATLTQRDPDA